MKVLILGGGFAALAAAETLAGAVGNEHTITLVSKSSEFTFYPAIVPMVFGDFNHEEIRFDLRSRLAEHRIEFVQGDVRGIDAPNRSVTVVTNGAERAIGLDYLIIALGRQLAWNAVPGLLEHAHHLLSMDAALRFKEAVSRFESGAIVVGLCPGASLPVPVCETALALAEKFSNEIRRSDISVTVVVPTTLDKAFEGAALFRDIETAFDRKGIRLVSDFPVARAEKDRIVSAFGESLRNDMLMLIPPFRGGLCLPDCDGAIDTFGFAIVNDLMQLQGASGIYAAGEIVSMPGPKFGYMAMRQGRVAAQNLMAEMKGEKPVIRYRNTPAWVIGEKYTDPVFFHYGVWDDTLGDFDEDALFGMARAMRKRYGPIDVSQATLEFEDVNSGPH